MKYLVSFLLIMVLSYAAHATANVSASFIIGAVAGLMSFLILDSD